MNIIKKINKKNLIKYGGYILAIIISFLFMMYFIWNRSSSLLSSTEIDDLKKKFDELSKLQNKMALDESGFRDEQVKIGDHASYLLKLNENFMKGFTGKNDTVTVLQKLGEFVSIEDIEKKSLPSILTYLGYLATLRIEFSPKDSSLLFNVGTDGDSVDKNDDAFDGNVKKFLDLIIGSLSYSQHIENLVQKSNDANFLYLAFTELIDMFFNNETSKYLKNVFVNEFDSFLNLLKKLDRITANFNPKENMLNGELKSCQKKLKEIQGVLDPTSKKANNAKKPEKF